MISAFKDVQAPLVSNSRPTAAPPPATRRRALLRDLLADRSGAIAVEFALVSLPLFFMLFAIIELAVVFMVSSSLDNATVQLSRTIRTGALQTSGGTATSFRNQICTQMGWLQSQCQTNLSVDVRTFAQFQNQNAPDPVQNGSFNKAALAFTPGQQGDIVLVRAFYQWKLLTPFLTSGLQRVGAGVTLLTSATTFRNEPYGS